jgi:hypothetical protein
MTPAQRPSPACPVKFRFRVSDGNGVDVHEIPGHNDNHNSVDGDVKGAVWQFLTTNKPRKDPDSHTLAELMYLHRRLNLGLEPIRMRN